MSDDAENDERFPLGLPPELLASLATAHDRQHMQQDANRARIDNFLDGLSADDLVTLRTILNAGDGSESVSNNFIDGQVVALLRRVHHVSPFGEPLMPQEAQPGGASDG